MVLAALCGLANRRATDQPGDLINKQVLLRPSSVSHRWAQQKLYPPG